MPTFTSTPAPVMTIWDAPVTANQRLPGIWHVTTASHGGFILSEERQAAMPEALRLDGTSYEEDVNWSLVVLAFQDELGAASDSTFAIKADLAHQIARSWLPDRYTAFTGTPVEPRESFVLQRRAAYEANIGKIVVVSAFGDWADWVPAGKVGVIGRRLRSVNHLGNATYEGADSRALVDADRYSSSAIVNAFDAIGAEPLA